MNKPPTIIGKLVYFIEGDEEAAEYQSMLIEHEGARWIVASWLQDRATGAKIPEMIIPLARFPHGEQSPGFVRLGQLMPRHIIELSAPPQVLHAIGAVRYPGLAAMPGPNTVQ